MEDMEHRRSRNYDEKGTVEVLPRANYTYVCNFFFQYYYVLIIHENGPGAIVATQFFPILS